MSEPTNVQTNLDHQDPKIQKNTNDDPSGTNQQSNGQDLNNNGVNPSEEKKDTNGKETHNNENPSDASVEVVQLRSPGKSVKEVLQEPRRRSGSFLLDLFKRKSSEDLRAAMKNNGSGSLDSPLRIRSPSVSIPTHFNNNPPNQDDPSRLSRSLPSNPNRRQSIAVTPTVSAQLQKKLKKEMKKEKKKLDKQNDNNNNSSTTASSSSSSDEEINTDSGGGIRRFFKGLLKGDLSIRMQGLQEDTGSAPPIDPKTQILNVTKYEELPNDLKKLVKASKIPKDQVKKNFDVLLNILAFQTKIKFQRVEDKKREAISMEKPAVAPPKSRTRPNLELESLLHDGDPRDIYKIMREEGKGGFGKVYKGVNKATGEKCAIKVMQHMGEKERRFNIGEFGFLRFCDHPNVVKYYGCYEHTNELWGIMEYLEGGTLEQAVKAYSFAENQIAYVAREVLRALEFLHAENLVHRDLKSGNIMLSTQGEIKIIDFGLCVDISSGMKTSMVGSPFWMPPEMIQRKPYDHKVDMWSLGICLMELANGNPPHAKSSIKAMFTVGTEGYPQPFEKPKLWSDDFKDFISLCLQMNPEERPTATELLQHPFMKKADTVKSMKNIISNIFVLSTMPF